LPAIAFCFVLPCVDVIFAAVGAFFEIESSHLGRSEKHIRVFADVCGNVGSLEACEIFCATWKWAMVSGDRAALV
jgi:hypothetical protein